MERRNVVQFELTYDLERVFVGSFLIAFQVFDICWCDKDNVLSLEDLPVLSDLLDSFPVDLKLFPTFMFVEER